MDTGSLVEKDPQAAAWPKGIDWTDYLARISATETIASSDWAVAGADAILTIDVGSKSIVSGSLKTQLKLSAGTLGLQYTVTNTIVTSSGITDERSFTVFIQQQ